LAAQEVQLFQVSKKMQNNFNEWWGLVLFSCLFDCHQRKEKLQQTFDKFKMTAQQWINVGCHLDFLSYMVPLYQIKPVSS
jgi:hypothetical protein